MHMQAVHQPLEGPHPAPYGQMATNGISDRTKVLWRASIAQCMELSNQLRILPKLVCKLQHSKWHVEPIVLCNVPPLFHIVQGGGVAAECL